MNAVWIVLAVVVALLVLWQVLQSRQSRRREEEARARSEQLQRDLQTLAGQTQNFSQQIGQMQQSVAQRLESVTQALHKGVTDSANISAAAQAAMSGELKNSREMIGQIQKQLGEVQEAGREMSQATQTLQHILGGAKSRGSLGEVTLERLLEDSLPSAQYAMQYRFASGEAADAVIFLRDKKLMAIDSKFPLDAYRRLSAEGDEARRAFATAVKGHADSIGKKYIVPNEGTLDVALMFVPSEAVYYEMLMTEDSKGLQLDAYCRERKVIAVSPNTLYAHLCVISMGLRGLQIEENAKRLVAGLSGMQKQMDTFTEVFEKLGTHLKNAQQSYSDADKRFEKVHNTLGGMLGTETAGALGEAGPGELSLPPAKNAKQIA
ncbi:MAG: DNA recombination protein RmuC [Acidobacteriia bacterium]|nr:DNA recombination protein RmuC [Terriglobia bacterium]